MRILHLSLLFVLHPLTLSAALATTKGSERQSRLEKVYTGVKIAGVATLSVVAVLAYLRVSKTLEIIDGVASQAQPAIKNIEDTLSTTRATVQHVHRTLAAMRPAFKRVPRITKELTQALRRTHITMNRVHETASNMSAITAQVNAALDPRVLAQPSMQALLQQTITSVASGYNAAQSAVEPTAPWSPANVAAAVAQHPALVSVAVRACFGGASTQPLQASRSTRAFRWIASWVRSKPEESTLPA